MRKCGDDKLGVPFKGRMPKNSRYLDRDLSWIEFNYRVLHQVYDSNTPLLEKLKFLAIFANNLDEFFMKRVGYLKRLIARGINQAGHSKSPPAQVLLEIHKKLHKMSLEADTYYNKKIIPGLRKESIYLHKWEDLDNSQKKQAKFYFEEKIFPVLTPLAVDLSRPFPFISNLSTSLGVNIKKPNNQELYFARVKVPEVLPQWVRVQGATEEEYHMIRLLDVMVNNLGKLFSDTKIEKTMPFRITRSADIDFFKDDVEDLMDVVEEELRLRRIGDVVRIETPENSDPAMLSLLQEELQVSKEDIYTAKSELNFITLNEIAKIAKPKLQYKSWLPITPVKFADEQVSVFQQIAEKDVLVHHPYHSFQGSVEAFIEDAVDDPSVLAIKMTLYRIGKNSPLIPLLIRAAENGKQVVCVIELKARFDEAQNIYWAELLEKAGVHVIFGIVGLKVHSKLTLVVRKEAENFKFYGHIATGNYNSFTSTIYTDFGVFTADPEITGEMIELFNYLTGHSLKENFSQFLVSPINMRSNFEKLIDAEIENAKSLKPAEIIAKMNSLEDKEIIEKLYEASASGVKIHLIVRGFCCLTPGAKGLSENIVVKSIVGRFLEHSRVYYFRSAAKTPERGKVFIGSADWMQRNLDRRFETIIPIKDDKLKKDLYQLLKIHLDDKAQSWDLKKDGSYDLRKYSDSDIPVQKLLMKKYRNKEFE